MHGQKLLNVANEQLEEKYALKAGGYDFNYAVGLMIEIENIKRFPKIKQIVAFYGLHPVFKESGDTSQNL